VVRALELTELGSSLRPTTDRLWTSDARYPSTIFGLDLPREALAERIERRARAMFDAGVAEEVRAALAQPISATAVHALGLREIAELSPDEALAALILRTRRYAAYQRKWMRRIPGLVTVNADRGSDRIADEIVEMARARQRLSARRAG
jgi:tRNA dimethylallyltransferase